MAESGEGAGQPDQETDEGIEETIQGLGETDDPAILYVIDRWGMVDDRIVVEGRVTEFNVTWEMKRGPYQSDNLVGQVKITPDNLKCDVIIQKATAEIVEASGDLGIVGQVFNRIAAELRGQTHQAMVQHMDNLYLVKNERIDAKEVPEPKTISVEL